MDYKEKYEQALEIARVVNPGTKDYNIVTTIFPELKEGEDERIRKEILEYFQQFENEKLRGVNISDWIAWLEKQGEQKPVDFSNLRTWKYIVDAVLTEKEGTGQYLDSLFTEEVAKKLQKRFGNIEQKPTDKVEPKFKVGDYIINEHGFIMQIDGIDSNTYVYHVLDNSNEKLTYDITKTDKSCHLWTIQDAKDGDVLSSNDGHGNDSIELIKSITDKKIEFWFCLTNSNRYEVFDGNLPYTNLASRKNAVPATQKQRTLLFQKMKEAGYKWDVERKELNKIKQDGNTYIIVEKEKKLAYEDVSEKLFLNREVVHFNDAGEIETFTCEVGHSYPTNCTSQKQAEKLLAVNKLMNVAKWVNDGWQPDWEDDEEGKHYISLNCVIGELFIDCTDQFQNGDVYFKSEELAKQAIEILGEETIKLALCTDY